MQTFVLLSILSPTWFVYQQSKQEKQLPEVFSKKTLLLKILQYSQENTCLGVSL